MGNTSLPMAGWILRCSGHRRTPYFIFFGLCAWVGRKSRWIFPRDYLPCVLKVLSQLISHVCVACKFGAKKKKGIFETPPTLFFLCWCSMVGEITHWWFQSIEIPGSILSTTVRSQSKNLTALWVLSFVERSHTRWSLVPVLYMCLLYNVIDKVVVSLSFKI